MPQQACHCSHSLAADSQCRQEFESIINPPQRCVRIIKVVSVKHSRQVLLLSIHCCTQSSQPTTCCQQWLLTGLRINFVIILYSCLTFIPNVFHIRCLRYFDIPQLSCQLRQMGGLVFTLVIIMIGVRYDQEYRPWQYTCFAHNWEIVLEWILDAPISYSGFCGWKKSWKLNSGQRFQKSAFSLREENGLMCKCACSFNSHQYPES